MIILHKDKFESLVQSCIEPSSIKVRNDKIKTPGQRNAKEFKE